MNFVMHITEPGNYQLVNGELLKVTQIDYFNEQWVAISEPCYVSVINGKIERVTPVKDSKCPHHWELYNGFVESYYHCTKCGECKIQNYGDWDEQGATD